MELVVCFVFCPDEEDRRLLPTYTLFLNNLTVYTEKMEKSRVNGKHVWYRTLLQISILYDTSTISNSIFQNISCGGGLLHIH